MHTVIVLGTDLTAVFNEPQILISCPNI